MIDNRIEQDIAREQTAWSKILGVGVEIKSCPSTSLTPEVRHKLTRHGYGVRVIPGIVLQTFANHEHRLKSQGPEAFLSAVNGDFPGLKPLELLTRDERMNPRVPRMLSETYWESVQDGRTAFPARSWTGDQWLAVELMPIPSENLPYRDSAVTRALGMATRRVTWENLESRLAQKRDALSAVIGLDSARGILIPTALQLSLLMNRDPKIVSNPSVAGEWTSTPHKMSPRDPNPRNSTRLEVGRQRYGGAGDACASYAGLSTAGFRLVIAF